MDKGKIIETILVDFIKITAIYLPDDVLNGLMALRKREKNERAAAMYDCIFKNIEVAEGTHRPLCQDTGILQFFIKCGSDNPYLGYLEDSIKGAVKKATEITPLRPNTIDFFGAKNTNDNLGEKTPLIEYEIIPKSDILEIELYLSGGGCSLPGKAIVLPPLMGLAGITDFIIDTVVEKGINACPPLIVGVGLSCCAPTAAMLSKKALLKGVGNNNSNIKAREMEEKIKEALNSVGIGPMGLKGEESVMSVNIEYATHHPATLGVGVSVGCWATRRGKVAINKDLTYTLLSHRRSLKQ